MAKLTEKERKKIPTKEFAAPGRKYPIEDKSHARNALARVAQHGTPAQKAEVRAKVHAKYPSIGREAPKHRPAKKKAEAHTPPRIHSGKFASKHHNAVADY